MRIAVIGSGIAGLTATWRLGLDHHVELFEARPSLGMDSSSVDVDLGGREVRIDVPLRVYGSGYYPNLLKLYAEAGVKRGDADYSASYSRLGGQTYFAYTSHHLRNHTLSLPDLRTGGLRTNLLRTLEGVRLFIEEPRRLAAGRVPEVTIEDYLKARGYSRRFTEDFLWPTLSAILTCPMSAARTQPAAAVIDFYGRIVGRGFSRVASGTQEVVQRLCARARRIHLGATVQGVVRQGRSVQLRTSTGPKLDFDHVIFATQVHRVAALLPDATTEELSALQPFAHTRFSCVVHQDPALMPRRREDWRPINALIDSPDGMPMYTMWMNAIVPDLREQAPLFQTINPLLDPQPKLVRKEVQLDRPLLSLSTLPAVRKLRALHQQMDRRVWFIGSYATEGFPLLEAAVVSANDAAQGIRRFPG